MRRGWELWHELCKVVPLPEKRHGGLLVAWTKEEASLLQAIQARAAGNGVETKLLTPAEVRRYAACAIAPAQPLRCTHTSLCWRRGPRPGSMCLARGSWSPGSWGPSTYAPHSLAAQICCATLRCAGQRWTRVQQYGA